MQPYFFPYIGYFQLMDATDTFIFYDDVAYIKRGWINRNRILLNGSDSLITVPCVGASQNKLINEVGVSDDGKWAGKMLTMIEHAYKKAPHYSEVLPVIEETLYGPAENIAQLAALSVEHTAQYLELDIEFKYSSKAGYNNQELRKQHRLIDICHQEGADVYINPIGGKEIYTKEMYAEKDVTLYFQQSKPIEYKQYKNEFVPWLSIIDVMMFNHKSAVQELLKMYTLT